MMVRDRLARGAHRKFTELEFAATKNFQPLRCKVAREPAHSIRSSGKMDSYGERIVKYDQGTSSEVNLSVFFLTLV